jgi:hypothetical protein
MKTWRLASSALATLLMLSGPTSAAAQGYITLTPSLPTSADSIHVVAVELFSGGHCWEVVSTTCTTAAPDSVLITAHIQLCGGNPGCPCTARPEPFQVSCVFPPLSPGSYRAVYQELHLNPIDSRHFPTHELLFTVSSATASLRRSWGRLKAIYR